MRFPSVLGPLFAEELNRLGRRNTVFVLRVGMAGFLLAAVAVQHPGDGRTVSISQQAQFAQSLFFTVVGVQLAAVWFLTPLFAAAVLTEEREKKTLDLLLTTTLTVREIVVGKLFARLTFVGGVLLAGLPVMAMLQVYGGVSVESLGLAYLGLFFNLWSIGGTTAILAASVHTYRTALYLTWLLLAFGAICPLFGPASLMIWVAGVSPPAPVPAATYFGCHALIGSVGLVLAVQVARPPVAADQAPDPVERKGTEPVGAYRAPAVVASVADRPPGIAADIDWRHPPGPLDGPTDRQLLIGGFVAAAALGLLTGLAMFEPALPRRDWPAHMILGWVPAALLAAVPAAGAVSREREAGTLTMLLTVPASRTEILWRKYLVVVTKHLWALGATGLFAGLVFLLVDGWEWYPGFLAQGVGMVGAAASVGILLSVVCRTTFLSQAAAVLAVLFLAGLPWWADAVYPDGWAVGFVPIHFAGLVFAAVAGWHLAAATFRGYAKR